MYTPTAFKLDDTAQQLQLMDQYPFATLIAQGPQGLMAMHLPVLLQRGRDGGRLHAHIARNNGEFADCPDGTEVLVVFNGPHAYISPSWYPTKKTSNGKAVPTWNYVAVHVHGVLNHQSDRQWLLSHLDQLVQRHESGRPDPWALADAPDDYLGMMAGQIVGLDIAITRIEGKAKLSQNRPPVDQRGVVLGLRNPQEPASSYFCLDIAALIDARLNAKP